jgi:hypothetical protein
VGIPERTKDVKDLKDPKDEFHEIVLKSFVL